MEFLLGPEGNLRALPVIERNEDVASSRGFPVALHETMAGRSSMDILGRSRGRWRLDWRYLSRMDRDLVHSLAAGHMGRALRLIDPSQPNQQHPNLASGGSETRDATDFLATYGDVSWVETDVPSGVYADGAIQWVRSGTLAGDLRPNDAALRIPVRAGVPIRFWLYWRQPSGTASADLAVDWWDASGVRSTTPGTAVQVPVGWDERVAVWTPPSGAVSAQIVVRVADAQVASTIEVTGLSATTDGTTTWHPGGGSALVLPEKLTEDRLALEETNVSLVLREV